MVFDDSRGGAGGAPVLRCTASIFPRHAFLTRLASVLLLSVAVAPLQAQADSTPAMRADARTPILSLPEQNGMRCRATPQRLGPDSVQVTSYEFEIPGELLPTRTLTLMVAEGDRVVALADQQEHGAFADTAVATLTMLGWIRDSTVGFVLVTRVDQAGIRRRIESGDIGPSTPAEIESTRAAQRPPREVTREEWAAASRLSDWLLARRCPLSPPPRPARP